MPRFHSLICIATACLLSSTGFAQSAPTLADASRQMQHMLGQKNTTAALGQAMVLGMLVNCTQKTAGKDATQSFYQRVKAAGENISAACKRKDSLAAQQLALATLDAQQNDPVLQSALSCYDAQSGAIAGMAGADMANDIAHYARWARNPAAAHQEIKPSDICR